MIKIGNTINLELNDPESGKKVFKSRILDAETDKIYIDFPVEKNFHKASFFFEGTQFRVWIQGNDQAIYMFDTEVLGKSNGKVPMLMLSDPGKDYYIRIQRRQHFRVDASIDVAVHSMRGEFQAFTTVSVDLSGGGMALILPKEPTLQPDQKINTWLSLHHQSGTIEYVPVVASFIRAIEFSGRLKGMFQFSEIEDTERQKIVQFCYEKQLEMKKKEKISNT
ncbi:pilus assembly protein PilZ [Salipaludibacillus neizhouensis]|uniref:Pilus assembly protein PilZ n=1 Tax=Salipaludibacillus neizhouensis TaxID=885475 RepID=A0A3A9KAM9_9BACI|nr:flagellar brake domain-containing protein [Salipaludibacillus neizhouensis]RKL67612.1 pilus assembly protein PilZ [Salipaludibacillus neizhouensis]